MTVAYIDRVICRAKNVSEITVALLVILHMLVMIMIAYHGKYRAFYQTITYGPDAVARHDFSLTSVPEKKEWTLLAMADPQVAVGDTCDFERYIMPPLMEIRLSHCRKAAVCSETNTTNAASSTYRI